MALIELRLEGVLTREALSAALAGIQPHIDASAGAVVLLVNCEAMTDYELEARAAFVTWNRENRARIERVAIVTVKPLWQMVVSAMSLASGQTLRPFSTAAAARAWLER